MGKVFCGLALFLAAFSAQQAMADTVTFTFLESDGLPGTIGADALDNTTGGMVTQISTDTSTPVTLSVVSVTAPDFSQGLPVGANLPAETNIGNQTSNGILGVDNQTITNDPFTAFTGITASESLQINELEELVLSFDSDFVFAEIDFFGITADEIATITVNGVSTDFGNTEDFDIFSDPLDGLLITAGTEVTFTVGADSAVALDTFVLTIPPAVAPVVPEPSSAVLGVFALAGILSRRRRTI